MWIEPEIFSTVVKHTPLISIDLIVRNDAGQVLLGKRINRPAQGFWFVPGGRIAKDERIEDAFSRLVQEELGISFMLENTRFIGPYQHFYQDNYNGTDFSTHYVVLGYELKIDIATESLPVEQHNAYRWFGLNELLQTENVHQHTKDYFISKS